MFPVCEFCNEFIVDRSITLFGGLSFHTECLDKARIMTKKLEYLKLTAETDPPIKKGKEK